jgi:hypothetical protein
MNDYYVSSLLSFPLDQIEMEKGPSECSALLSLLSSFIQYPEMYFDSALRATFPEQIKFGALQCDTAFY